MDMSRNLARNVSGAEWVAHREVGRRPQSRGREPLVRRHAHLCERADASPLPVGRRDSPAGAHPARASLVLPTPSLPLQPRVVSLGRQLLRHRLRQQLGHPLPLVVAHRADDCLQPLRRYAVLLTSGCGRGMRLWGQKYQTGVNTAIDKKLGQDRLRNPAPQNPKVFCLIPLWVITPSCRTPSQEICKRIPHNRCSCTSRRARRHDA